MSVCIKVNWLISVGDMICSSHLQFWWHTITRFTAATEGLSSLAGICFYPITCWFWRFNVTFKNRVTISHHMFLGKVTSTHLPPTAHVNKLTSKPITIKCKKVTIKITTDQHSCTCFLSYVSKLWSSVYSKWFKTPWKLLIFIRNSAANVERSSVEGAAYAPQVMISFQNFEWHIPDSWWRHQMETFSASLAFVQGIHQSPVKFCLGLSLLRVKLHRQTGLLCLSSRLFEHKMSKPFWGPFYEHGWALIPEWIDNYIYYNVWDEITYPFLNSTMRLLKFGKGLDISSHILLGM